MKVTLVVALLAALVLIATVEAFDVSGNWVVDAVFDDSTIPGGEFDCVFTQEGERLTGHCSLAQIVGEVAGGVEDQHVGWQMKAAGDIPETMVFAGMLAPSGTAIEGAFLMGRDVGHFTASKK